jgi:hypothetical protein
LSFHLSTNHLDGVSIGCAKTQECCLNSLFLSSGESR